MNKEQLQIITLDNKRIELEKELDKINIQLTNLRKLHLKKKYGLK